ncbi:MAG: PEGA domain-containing protein [Vicinamibacterales bacterium]
MSRPPLPFRPTVEPASEADPGRPTPLRGPGPSHVVNLASDAAPLDAFGSESEGLSSFDSESEGEIRYKTQKRAPSANPGALVILLAVAVIGGILALTYLALRKPSGPEVAVAATPAAPPMGQAQFDSRPSGADVVVDGVVRGKTPLKLSLPVGDHALEIRGDAGTRSLPLNIEAGVLVSQYVELVAVPEQLGGRVEITSEPAGAQVRVDGVTRGVTPLTLDAVPAGTRTVALSRGGATIYRSVRVTPGATASVFASMSGAVATAGALGGYLAITAPIELQVFEGGRLLGSTDAERLMLPTGRHQLELVNTEFQFRHPVEVVVEAGKTVTPEVPVPNGSLSVNALPWADVLVDGQPVGTTPLANLTIPIGSHEVTWRHPQLGERKQTVTVTPQTPVRVGVNFAP